MFLVFQTNHVFLDLYLYNLSSAWLEAKYAPLLLYPSSTFPVFPFSLYISIPSKLCPGRAFADKPT